MHFIILKYFILFIYLYFKYSFFHQHLHFTSFYSSASLLSLWCYCEWLGRLPLFSDLYKCICSLSSSLQDTFTDNSAITCHIHFKRPSRCKSVTDEQSDRFWTPSFADLLHLREYWKNWFTVPPSVHYCCHRSIICPLDALLAIFFIVQLYPLTPTIPSFANLLALLRLGVLPYLF